MKNILYVEHSKLFQLIVEERLSKYGCNFLKAKSGEEAIEILNNEAIDYIFSAKVLEDMDIEDLVERLYENGFNDIPIILISSIEEIKEIKDFFKLGITDYILKNDIGNEETLDTLLKDIGIK